MSVRDGPDEALLLDMDDRIKRAVSALRQLLNNWNVGATLHVGFEILVPSLLNLLEAEGYVFDFQQRSRLMDSYSKKMRLFDSELLYSNDQYSALHSLEAFIGKIDFDRLKHHTRDGSMFASPSSTAAYLMHASNWDDDSEAYLRRVITHGEGRGSGGVPSAFPSTNFDLIWTISTLFQGGFSVEELGLEPLEKISEIVATLFEKGDRLLGFGKDLRL
ncbi:MAG: hypothetical protein Q9219_004973 [cf. Caloplaca sp. 3 TL-2023]